MIIVDSREPREIIALLTKEKLPVKVVDIEWTDYLVCHENYIIPVERKTAEDFVASIIDGRIFNQAYTMSTLSPVGYIIVEGTPTVALLERQFPRKAYIGALASLALKRSPHGCRGQVSVVVVETHFDTAMFLTCLHKQLVEGELERLPVLRVTNKRQILDSKACLITMLQGIPGIGVEKAKAIAEKFGSMWNLVHATPEQLAQVGGISLERAYKILQLLGSPVAKNIVLRGKMNTK